jgi:glycosyltransferase involved in cell wall biosynthesis
MPENPKVLIFIKGLDLGGLSGGADLFGINLACELHKHGTEVNVCVCYRFNTEVEKYYLNSFINQGITPYFLLDWDGHPSVIGYFNAFRKFNELLKGFNIDVIHSHFHTGTFLSIILKLIGRVKWVVRTAHVDREWMRGWDGYLQQTIIRTLIFVIFPIFVDVEIGVSTYTVEILNQRLLTRVLGKQAILIHNAIPINDDFELLIDQKNFSEWQCDHPIVGTVGRLEEQKGYRYLMAALVDVLLQYPNLEAWIIGDGPLRGDLGQQCIKLGIANKVVFWGKQNNTPDFLSKMDLFVSSSLYEGLPTVVLEAMAHGIPCVVTDIPGTKDIVNEKNVVVVPASDSRALSQSICQVLSSFHLRQTLVESAKQTVDMFRLDHISMIYLDAYRKL